jgi:hypothetical protein
LEQQGDLVPAAQARPDLAHFFFGAAAAGAAATRRSSASASASAAPWRAIVRMLRREAVAAESGRPEKAFGDHNHAFARVGRPTRGGPTLSRRFGWERGVRASAE